MRDVLTQLLSWWRAGEPVAVATVVATYGSAPRQPGASMLVGPAGVVVGSVSGGCVEGAVYDLAQQVLASGDPVLQCYGISDGEALAVGLTCGGKLEVFVERIDPTTFPQLDEVADDLESAVPVAVATVIEHVDASRRGSRMLVHQEDVSGSLGSSRIDDAVRDDALGMLNAGTSGSLSYGPDGERRGEGMRVFVSAFTPQPRMLVFGAIDFAAAVARIGSFLGYRVTVCDARPIFATTNRFPEVDEVVVDWPHRYLAAEAAADRIDSRTVLCILTHDPKFDLPLLEVALRLPALAYVGAMGSRRTHRTRRDQLLRAGFNDAQLGRLSSPTGLDLGARTPEETAISIAAEIIAMRRGGTGQRLAALDGPIHHQS